MDAKIQNQIIDYFSFFEEFHISAKTCLKDCQNCAVSINKQIIRCRKIKQAELTDTPLQEFVGLQSKLLASLHNQISEEIAEIRSSLFTVEELFDKLCNKSKILQDSCNAIDFTQQTPLLRGTPYQPPLKQLLEFAEDTVTFGSEICAQVETSLNVLTFKGLNTESSTDNFKISTNWQRKIAEILAYTSYCSENQI